MKAKEKVRFWSDEKVAELESLMSAGKTRDEIADIFDTTILVIAKKLKEYIVEDEV